ncbi:hypothetical protein A3F66_00950 [candidate division TM6 bacterium RIFCSPHIGHO2_12_FULL_32_22]|nr:MAG: hypothetical protein A3F66_00950 [candidate division TM6 bacterium RIFCSPHIGHO2_12_FULL_32_22]
MKITIIITDEYEIWFEFLTIKEQAQVIKRLNRIQEFGVLGDSRNLREGLYELRWKNGWRVYFIRVQNGILLLLGGNKNDQKKDIKKARKIISRYTDN